MLTLSDRGINLIQHFEGFSAQPYRCPAGYWTIGYGHMLTVAQRMVQSPVSETEAKMILMQDVRIAENAVRQWITVPLAQYQFDALVSFTYNLGAAVLQRSTLRQVINRGEHAAAPAEFRRWVWAGGRKLAGLVRRRAMEALLYQTASGSEIHQTVT